MSYILEALKKIERRRQLEVSPTSLSGLGTPETEAPKRPLWPYLLAVALILNTGVLLWWIVFRGPYQPPRSAPMLPQRTSVKTVPTVPQPPVTSPAQDAEHRKTAREQTPTPAGSKGQEGRKASVAPPEKLPVSNPVKTAMPAGKPPSLPATPKSPADQTPPGPPPKQVPATEPVKTPPPPDKKASTSDQAKVPPLPTPKKEVLRSDRIFNLNDLPADIRGALPPLKISAHVYSPEPSSRLVRVNEMLLQEGQALPEGLKVEEILTNGVIFRFQGTRFRTGIQGN